MRAFDQRTRGETERRTLASVAQLRARADDLTDDELQAALAAVLPSMPTKIQIQTDTRCNAACEMCPYPGITSESSFAHSQMSDETYREILRQLAGKDIERLSLFLMNEPLLDRRLPAWIALARQALPSVTIGLFSNGSPLTPRLALTLADAGLDELCVSVHGFDADTYDAVMKGLSFARVEPRLRGVLELFEQGRLGGMHIQLVTGDLPELRASLDRAVPILGRHTLLKAFSNERAASDVALGLPSSRARDDMPSVCQRPFVKLYVLTNGDCVLCNVDWRKTVVLGRIGPEPDGQIGAIWRGPRYQRVRLAHLRRRFVDHGICRHCDYPAVVDED